MKNLALPLALVLLALGNSAYAQSITPAPDGVGTVINHNGNTYYIGGGTQAGANLFHSFQEFGLSPNEIANFLSNPQIQNVVGRVIGGNPSVIQGLIQLTGGNSNLYLMNPAGWVFTNGASLDVPGSFGVTTANRIGFGSGFFNAVGANNFETLLGSPSSLIFDTTQPGAILNAADLSVANGSLWMVGGSVINTGTLSTPNGTVTLAAVPGTSQVKLTADGMTLGLLLDALPAGEITPNTPLGLKPEDLPRYLAGGSHIGNATGVEVGADGGLYLVGSAMRLEQGEVVIAGEIAAETVQLMAVGTVTPTEPGLVQGKTTVVRFPEAGGTNILSVIDRRADNPEALLYGGAAGTISRIIERDENGLGVISETLAKVDGPLDGVAITAEGHEGNFWLGRNWINSENVGDHAQELGQWSAHLQEGADLLLYSCFTALGAVGEEFVAALGSLTGLDVAASVNATGSANLGGDWVLESSTGTIESLTPFSDLTLSVWEGRLANQTVTNLADSGAGSLRQALLNVGDSESVTFGVTGTVNLLSEISWGQEGVTIDGNGSTVKGNNTFRIFNSTATTGTTTIQNLTITGGNVGAGQNGGGIRSSGAVTLNNSSVSGNSGFLGGGIYSFGALTLTNSTVSGNSAGSTGGGINSGGAVTLTNSTVSGNSSAGSGGGILSLVAVTLTNSTVSGNWSAGGSGGILSHGAVTLTNSTVSGNSAPAHGGGISGGAVTLTNSTVSGNSVGTGGGGGISSFGAVTLTNSTIAFNTAARVGGGMHVLGTYTHTINNSIIANNSAGTGGPDIGMYSGTPTFNITNSLILSTAGMSGTGIPTNGVNGNIIGIDPQLAPLANNGGPTQTHALALTSPALNTGSNALAAGLTTDQRGAPGARIVGGTVDMGAFEWQGSGIIVPIGQQNQTVNRFPSTLDVSVRVVEKVFNLAPVVGASVNFSTLGTVTGSFTNGATVITNANGVALNFFEALRATGDFQILSGVTGLEPLTFKFTNAGLDLALIRQIWLDPIENTEALIDGLVLKRACASIPNLELEQDEENPSTEDEPLDAADQIELDENCLPLSE